MPEENLNRAENIDDIVFAHRNKKYGAYEIRKMYKKNVTRSLFLVLLFTIIISLTPLIRAINSNLSNKIINETIEAKLLKIENYIEKITPPPPPPLSNNSIEKKVKYDRPEVVDSVIGDINIKTNDDLIDHIKSVEPDDYKDEPPVIKPIDIVVDFYKIEEKPEFPGGDLGLIEWIINNTIYPVDAKKEGITGKVYVSFIIDKDGNVTDVALLNRVDPNLDKEALRVVSSMPVWKPGKQGGERVKVAFQLPIKFTLK
jgi:periplasmic protein TonB